MRQTDSFAREDSVMLNLSESHGPLQQVGQTEIHEFRLLIAIAVAWFFVIVVVSRLLPRTWRPFASKSGQRESWYGEARRMAYTVIPYAFMR
jgi:hypothetical protein